MSERQVTLKPGWLKKEIDAVEKEIRQWPKALLESLGIKRASPKTKP